MRLCHAANLKLLEFRIWTMRVRHLWKAAPIVMAQVKHVQDVMAKFPLGRNWN